MGLDLLDIVYRVERAFGVRLNAKDFFEAPTAERPAAILHTKVGELYDLILDKRKALGLSKGNVRPEVFAMRDVRLALADVLHITRCGDRRRYAGGRSGSRSGGGVKVARSGKPRRIVRVVEAQFGIGASSDFDARLEWLGALLA